jgi:energy-coupling factor transporter ATP-binding protein EcfA2
MDNNFIKEIQIGEYRSANKHVMPIAWPKDTTGAYCITVICGKNNTGKSHILKQLSEAFHVDRKFHNENEKESINVHAVLTDPADPMPNVLYFDSTTFAKSRFNVIPAGEYKHDPTGKKPRYRDAAIRFIGRQVQNALGNIDEESWENDASYRLHFIHDKVDKESIYRCDKNDEVVKRFEEAVEGRLYFRYFVQAKSEFLELVLRYDEHRVFRYPSWSDGQQTLFAGLLIIDYHRPDVLLIDEIENHFHPEYITQFAIFIKKIVPQTILVTHHPHMLFSKLVDKLYYMELKGIDSEDPPPNERFDRTLHPRSPKRNIKELITDFDLITAAYGLFHNQDRQLLHLAEKLHHAVDVKFTKILIELFKAEAVPSGEDFFLDAQSIQLIGVIKRSVEETSGAIEILDYGAGRGRTLLEVLKEPQAKRGFIFRWSFWEKDPGLRRELALLATNAASASDIRVIDNMEGVAPDTFHIAILSNILHEVTPKEFARILTDIRRVIKSDSGRFVVLELTPLIHPEKYAVPYTRELMESVLHKIGWRIDSGNFPVRSGLVQAYWVCAHSPDSSASFDQGHIQKVVEDAWEQILEHNCLLYDGKYKVTSADDQIRLIDYLTTIASVMNYRLGNWT